MLCPYTANAPPSNAPATKAATTQPKVRWEPNYGGLLDGPDGNPCIATKYEAVPVDTPPPDVPWDPNMATTTQAGQPIYPCPPTTQTAQAVAAQIAVQGWEEVPLPVPHPNIAPGRAITGKWAYVETHNQLSYDFRKDTEVGTLVIHATGRYMVDWGDGTSTGPYSGEGRPWPDGAISHQYINVGRVDVVVVERWTATWQIGPWSGTLYELRTVGRIDGFPVEQIQAVIGQ